MSGVVTVVYEVVGEDRGVSSVECCWYLSCEGLCTRKPPGIVCVAVQAVWKLCVGTVKSHLCSSSSCFLVTLNTLLSAWDKPDKV